MLLLLFTQANDTFYACQRPIYRCYFRIGTTLYIAFPQSIRLIGRSINRRNFYLISLFFFILYLYNIPWMYLYKNLQIFRRFSYDRVILAKSQTIHTLSNFFSVRLWASFHLEIFRNQKLLDYCGPKDYELNRDEI